MKVYVDELPKDCWECPCFRNDIDFPCGLGDGTKDYFLDEIDGGECPLKSLKEHDKQVIKETCDRIIDLAQIYSFGYAKDCYAITEKDLLKILHMVQIDQIKGGINDK